MLLAVECKEKTDLDAVVAHTRRRCPGVGLGTFRQGEMHLIYCLQEYPDLEPGLPDLLRVRQEIGRFTVGDPGIFVREDEAGEFESLLDFTVRQRREIKDLRERLAIYSSVAASVTP